ncbi:MAG TPA: DMT family transporter, partial [Streptosporangiaceae bacterium]|nr:DMT family transporter [Streptosporangiaceae bacterium]
LVAQRSQNLRPLALALACGICYGVAAFLVKLVTGDFSGGLSHLFTSWPIYAVAVVGPVGFVLNQDAFQQGTLIAPVMSIITAADPLVSIALGVVFLDEKLNSSPAGIVGEIASLVVMVTGIVIIAHHAPQVVRQREEEAASCRATPPVT